MSSDSRPSTVGGALPPSTAGGTGASGPAVAPRAGLWAGLRAFAEAHPRLLTWLVLGVGMVAILLWAARSEPLLLHQRLVLVAATVGLAGLCAWIIHWE